MPLGHLVRLRATAHASTLTLIYAYHEPAYRSVLPAKEHELKRTHLGAMHQAYADEFSDTSPSLRACCFRIRRYAQPAYMLRYQFRKFISKALETCRRLLRKAR